MVRIEIAGQTGKEIRSKLLQSTTMNSFNFLDEIRSHPVLCGLGLLVCYVSSISPMVFGLLLCS
jgi:hypothetical protein